MYRYIFWKSICWYFLQSFACHNHIYYTLSGTRFSHQFSTSQFTDMHAAVLYKTRMFVITSLRSLRRYIVWRSWLSQCYTDSNILRVNFISKIGQFIILPKKLNCVLFLFKLSWVYVLKWNPSAIITRGVYFSNASINNNIKSATELSQKWSVWCVSTCLFKYLSYDTSPDNIPHPTVPNVPRTHTPESVHPKWQKLRTLV